MDTRPVLRWTIEETPATATSPRHVWVRAVWDQLPVAWAGPSPEHDEPTPPLNPPVPPWLSLDGDVVRPGRRDLLHCPL